jgi:cytochrome d ubiquinol oxidase subunit I
MDLVLLSRIQFALTVMFHYLFPPLSIGMGVVLVHLDWKWLRTGEAVYEQAAKFWTRIFAMNFAVGVATGIVMEFEFGTNWATYSRFVGDVFGSALAAEGIFAFFLESGFLAVLVFGWDRVSRPVHFFSTCMVSLGSIFSSIWIVVANSWQQTPAGSKIVPIVRDGKPWVVDGQYITRAEFTDFWAVVFNPSTVHRLTHVLLGCFIMGAFFVLSISAWYLLHGRHVEFARRSFRGALILAAVSSLAIAISGHFQARNVYQHQPAKIAAFEALYSTTDGGTSMALLGWPNDAAQRVDGEISVPGLLSLLVHDDPTKPVLGLVEFRPEHRPTTLVPFLSYRVMVGSGLFFIALTLFGCWRLYRGRLFDSRWLMWLFVAGVVPAVAANQSGWVAAEVGRQPWIVHPQVQRTADGEIVRDPEGFVSYQQFATPDGKVAIAGMQTTAGVSRAIRAEQVVRSIIMFGLLYILLGALWVFLLHRKIVLGPDPDMHPSDGQEGFMQVAADQFDAKLSPGRDQRQPAAEGDHV